MKRGKTKQSKKLKKIKYFILPSFFLLVILFFGVIFYYKFDPSMLARLSFYVDLANPSVRIVRINEGLRKEEIAELIAEKLDWNEAEKIDFINAHLALKTDDLEGRYFPNTYLLDKDEDPLEASQIMIDEFSKQTSKIKKTKASDIINPDTALTIASMIQREAGGKSDMHLISGIIWNRIFNGMKLQIDATLQYAKGSEEEGWWGRVHPEDKKIDSEYNTYMYKGLPPGAIANPGLAAIEAAYNPAKTNCLFYLHDKKRKIHCSPTYEGHLKNIQKYY